MAVFDAHHRRGTTAGARVAGWPGLGDGACVLLSTHARARGTLRHVGLSSAPTFMRLEMRISLPPASRRWGHLIPTASSLALGGRGDGLGAAGVPPWIKMPECQKPQGSSHLRARGGKGLVAVETKGPSARPDDHVGKVAATMISLGLRPPSGRPGWPRSQGAFPSR